MGKWSVDEAIGDFSGGETYTSCDNMESAGRRGGNAKRKSEMRQKALFVD